MMASDSLDLRSSFRIKRFFSHSLRIVALSCAMKSKVKRVPMKVRTKQMAANFRKESFCQIRWSQYGRKVANRKRGTSLGDGGKDGAEDCLQEEWASKSCLTPSILFAKITMFLLKRAEFSLQMPTSLLFFNHY